MRGAVLGILVAIFSILFPAPAPGMEPFGAGIRFGVNATDKNEDFTQAELFLDTDLPWEWVEPGAWKFTPHFLAAAGILTAAEQAGFIGSVGFAVAATSPSDRFEVEVGGGTALLSRDRFERHNFGGPVQFIARAGVHWYFSPRLGLGYRFQHMSNGRLYEENNGLELHMIELRCRF